jgi:Fic family protein
MAMGYYELLGTIFTSCERLQFNESAIRLFHRELLKYAEGDSERPSEYKQRENKVRAVDDNGKILGIIFDTSAPARTAAEMKDLVEWTVQSLANNTYHPLLVIGNFIVEFLCIHPFQEGNGPLSRVLADLLLLQAGYAYGPFISHEKLIEANIPGYYLALCSSQKIFNTVVPWMDYFTGVLIEQAELAMDFLEQGSIENVLSEKQATVWRLFQEGEVLTPGEIADKLSIARPTVNQVLTKLLKLEKIDRMGLGRAVRYKIK